MLSGGGLSQRWYISTTGLGTEVLDTTCWSWMVLLLKAFLMLMSCRETKEHKGKKCFTMTAQTEAELVAAHEDNIILQNSGFHSLCVGLAVQPRMCGAG